MSLFTDEYVKDLEVAAGRMYIALEQVINPCAIFSDETIEKMASESAKEYLKVLQDHSND